MLINEKQKQFLQLRIVDGKSLRSISETLDVPVHILKEWSVSLVDYLEETRLNEIDQIAEDSGIQSVPHLKNLAKLYRRLKKELDNRDFSGLPTDKLFYIYRDVHDQLKHQMLGDDYDDDWDEFDDFDDDDEF